MNVTNLFTVDVEEFHDRLAFKRYFDKTGFSESDSIKDAIGTILSLLKKHDYSGTFFTLGKTALRHPELIKRIAEEGHEIASHGYSHSILPSLDARRFDAELAKTEVILKKATGKKLVSFRAPKFSLSKETAWAIDILKKRGYRYDSSLFPFNMLAFGYGEMKGPIHPYRISSKDIFSEDEQSSLTEFPLAVGTFGSLRFPVKMRHMGSGIASIAVRNLNKRGLPANLLVHPWEMAPIPKGFKTSMLDFKGHLRNYNIPMTRVIERLFGRHRFTSLSEYAEGIR